MDAVSPDAAEFLERMTVRALLNVAPVVIDHGRRVAHQLYQAGRLAEAEVVCRGLIACDHRFAWTYSLHAAVLRRQGRPAAALAQVVRGLSFEPEHAKLRSMRVELTAWLAAPRADSRSDAGGQPSPAQRTSGRTDSDP